MDNGGITQAEMVEMCERWLRRVIAEGDPFNGDDWELYQIVLWALNLNQKLTEVANDH